MAAHPSRPPVNCRSAPELSGSRVEDRAATPLGALDAGRAGAIIRSPRGAGRPPQRHLGLLRPSSGQADPRRPAGATLRGVPRQRLRFNPVKHQLEPLPARVLPPARIASPPSTQLDEAARYLSVGPTPRVRLGLPRSRESTRATRGERSSTELGARCSERPSIGTAVPPNRTPGANPGHVAVPALTWVRPGDWTGPALYPSIIGLRPRPGRHAVSPVSGIALRGGCTLDSAAIHKQQLIGLVGHFWGTTRKLSEFLSPADVAD